MLRTRNSFAAGLTGVLLAALLALPAPVAAGTPENSGVPGDWLARFQSARSLGLGGAFAASADDPLGVVWNPAGLTQLFRNELRAETAQSFEGTTTNAVALGVPNSRYPSFGLSMLSMGSGEFERTNELNAPQGEFSVGETAFLFTAAHGLTRDLALGASFKIVSQDVESFSASGFGADLGLLYSPVAGVRLGVSLLNLGGPVLRLRETDESYPLEVRAGGALSLLAGRGLLSLEVDHRDGPGATAHVGGEFWVMPAFALRAGYDTLSPVGGIAYRLNDGFQFDYAISDHELGMTHRLGLVFRFGGYAASSYPSPSAFSPMGATPVTTIRLRARTKDSARDWSLTIEDKSGVVVRRFGGQGSPPGHVPWDGKSEAGLPLPDGSYRFRLVVTDLAGRSIEGPEEAVEILTRGPEGTVPLLQEDTWGGDQ